MRNKALELHQSNSGNLGTETNHYNLITLTTTVLLWPQVAQTMLSHPESVDEIPKVFFFFFCLATTKPRHPGPFRVGLSVPSREPDVRFCPLPYGHLLGSGVHWPKLFLFCFLLTLPASCDLQMRSLSSNISDHFHKFSYGNVTLALERWMLKPTH